jgi:CDP-4-dehydro-6-deoxyglucose reductase, E1
MYDAQRNSLIESLSQDMPPYVPHSEEFVPGESSVLYSGPYWNHREMQMAMEALLTGRWLTAGEYVARFQNMFGKRFRTNFCHMVNSGSSANLIMIAALKKHLGWQDGDEVIVSPVGFPTTIAPLMQNGLKPVFVDIEMSTLNFDTTKIHEKITNRTVAIFVSPVLGNPPDMDALKALGITLIGDNCDSLGSRWNGKLLNELYYSWTTSFYPAHHITTGEGGMVCSNDKNLMDTVRSISWWGRDCYCVGVANLLSNGTCGNRFSKWLDGTDATIDHKYVFTNVGYNVKPLDLQGAIGLAQLEKIDDIESRRRLYAKKIFEYITSESTIKDYARVATVLPQADPCWFGVPIICHSQDQKERLVAFLEKNKIQTRGYFAGNILRHAAYKHLGSADEFPNANLALTHVFFLGCAPHYTPTILMYIGNKLKEWAEMEAKRGFETHGIGRERFRR